MIAAQQPLAPGEARVFYAFSAALASAELTERCRGLLSDEELAREQRFRFVEDQQTYLLAHALTRSLLSALSGAPPRALQFENGPHGRPELAFPVCAPRVRFNLSHTRGLVACAVALEHDVGVDVEHADRRVDIDQLAPTVFSDAERAALARLHGDARRTRFFQLWTLKEAYIKAVGKGLALRLQAISLELDAATAPQIAFSPPVQDDPHAWSLRVEPPRPGYMLALAVKVPAPLRISVQELAL